MDRRCFISVGGLAAAVAAVPAVFAQSATPSPSTARVSKMKLGCQSGPSNDEHFAYFARYGVRNVCGSPKIEDPARLYPTIDELKGLQDLGTRHGITIDLVDSVLLQSSHIDREKNPSIMLAESPQRDRDIEAFQTLIRNCAAVGIPAVKYNMSILGVLRTGHIPGRGDAQYGTWKYADAKPNPPLTRAGVVDADRFWERIFYFLDRVIPVAEEYKVRIACHPHDPGVPPGGYQGVDRVLGTVDGLKKFVAYRDSAYHGLNFCQGTVSENLTDPANQIFDVIRYFGERRKIFNVHFRNIRGRRDDFAETFPDDGDVDMLRALRVYKEVGYDGMLMPDHVPQVPGRPEATRESFAFAYGYIRGLMQAVDA
jgi:mannonate dehydratase